MNDAMPILEVKRLAAGYGNHTVLTDVSFRLNRGENLAIIGQNGSGKSTLLKAICGIIPLEEGGVWVEGKGLHKIRAHELVTRGISYFVQGGLVMPSLTVGEHLVLATRQNGKSGEQEAFETVHGHFPKLKGLHKQRAGNLSGGERQLLSLGILLMQGTHIWLLDEPTTGLAPEMVQFTVEFLQRKTREDHISMIIVEHNMEVAFHVADHLMVAKEGTLTGKYGQEQFMAKGFLEQVVYN